MKLRKLIEVETPQRVAQALPQTKEVDQKKLGKRFLEYLQDNGLKHAAYMNEDGCVKVVGLNKEQVKTALERVIKEYQKKNEGLPGGAGVGLSLPGGYINGAPTEDDVKKTRKGLKEGVAETILQQLGGNRFIMMTGAKNFLKDESKGSLQFSIGRNSKAINRFRITLNPNDLYDLESIRGTKVVEKKEDIYNEDLQKVFTQMTGLYTHL